MSKSASLRAAIYAFAMLSGSTNGLEAQGTVTDDSLFSLALGTQKRVKIYLPPSYHRTRTRPLWPLWSVHS